MSITPNKVTMDAEANAPTAANFAVPYSRLAEGKINVAHFYSI